MPITPTAERLGVDILYDTEVSSLNMDDGSVRAADITYRGFPGDGARRACVVASAGGFQANIDWMRQYWGDAADNFVIRGTPYDQGRVLKNLLDQGVAPVGDPTQFHAVAIDAPRAEIRRRHRHATGLCAFQRSWSTATASASTTRARMSGRSATPSGAA